MTLKYNTQDEEFDTLRQQVQNDHKRSSRNFYMFWPYLVIGALGHMVHDAQSHMVDLPKTKVWSFFGYHGSDVPITVKWVGYVSATASLVLGLAYKVKEWHNQNAIVSFDMRQSSIMPTDVHQTGLSGPTSDREIALKLPAEVQNSKATNTVIQAASTKTEGCVKTLKINELL